MVLKATVFACIRIWLMPLVAPGKIYQDKDGKQATTNHDLTPILKQDQILDEFQDF